MERNMPEGLLVESYLEWLDAQNVAERVDGAAEPPQVVREARFEAQPFFSVICRTQGERMEELAEALASLDAQACRDFQLIVVAHNAGDAARGRISGCLEALADWLLARTTFIAVRGGSRTRPLNAALPFVEGRFFSALDEDDVAYANWIESFAELSAGRADCMMYGFVETQLWRVVESADGVRMLEPAEAGKGERYCHRPNALRQLVENRCPFMGLAFPGALVRELGFRFEEGLETTEDWQFLLRACNVYPLVTTEARVALYRQWNEVGGHSSATVSPADWQRNSDGVQAELARTPLLFGEGFSTDVRELLSRSEREECFLVTEMEMFVDTGAGFGPGERATPTLVPHQRWTFAFKGLERFGPMRAFRIDPQHRGPLAILSFSVEARFADGSARTLGLDDAAMNGRVVGGQIEFPGDDPQLVFALPEPARVSEMVFRFQKGIGFVEPEERPDDGGARGLFRRRAR